MKRKAMPDHEVDKLFANNEVFFKKPKKQDKPVEESFEIYDIPNDTVDDIAEGVSAGNDSMNERLDLDALEEVVNALYWKHAGKDQLQIKISSQELELAEKYIDQFKKRDLEHNSLTVPKLFRYCTVYMLLNHPLVLKRALRNALKKQEGSSIINNN